MEDASLDKIGDYKEKIEILEIQVEDAYRMIERYILENERLGERVQTEEEKRVSMTRLQIAVSLLIFVYGWLYGSYFKCN